MLREASISELRSRDIPPSSRVLVNRGRGHDELAPREKLFEDFNGRKKMLERELGRGSAEAHNQAFIDARIEAPIRGMRESQLADALSRTRGIGLHVHRRSCGG